MPPIDPASVHTWRDFLTHAGRLAAHLHAETTSIAFVASEAGRLADEEGLPYSATVIVRDAARHEQGRRLLDAYDRQLRADAQRWLIGEQGAAA